MTTREHLLARTKSTLLIAKVQVKPKVEVQAKFSDGVPTVPFGFVT